MASSAQPSPGHFSRLQRHLQVEPKCFSQQRKCQSWCLIALVPASQTNIWPNHRVFSQKGGPSHYIPLLGSLERGWRARCQKRDSCWKCEPSMKLRNPLPPTKWNRAALPDHPRSSLCQASFMQKQNEPQLQHGLVPVRHWADWRNQRKEIKM